MITFQDDLPKSNNLVASQPKMPPYHFYLQQVHSNLSLVFTHHFYFGSTEQCMCCPMWRLWKLWFYLSRGKTNCCGHDLSRLFSCVKKLGYSTRGKVCCDWDIFAGYTMFISNLNWCLASNTFQYYNQALSNDKKQLILLATVSEYLLHFWGVFVKHFFRRAITLTHSSLIFS